MEKYVWLARLMAPWQMADDSEEREGENAFNTYIDEIFPVNVKRTRSAVIRRQFAKRIVDYLKGRQEDDKGFRHFVKKSGFKLLDLPAVGVRDALVVRIKQEKQVNVRKRFC